MNDGVLIRFRLVGDEAEALRELSALEMRTPRDQTRFILRRELERKGLIPGDRCEGNSQEVQVNV